MIIEEFNETLWHDKQNFFLEMSFGDSRHDGYKNAGEKIDRILGYENRVSLGPLLWGLDILQILCHLVITENTDGTYKVTFDPNYTTRNPLSGIVYEQLKGKIGEVNSEKIQKLLRAKLASVMEEKGLISSIYADVHHEITTGLQSDKPLLN